MELTEQLWRTTIERDTLLKGINRAMLPKLAKITVQALTCTLLMIALWWVVSPVAEAIIKLDSLVVALRLMKELATQRKTSRRREMMAF